ncbi:hypothetical protein ACFQDG_01135 [Natronoarchaeum mannanilyticum]|uniref:Uncharacterized protein n=1 Tax=Natronoarchaeum mannanilyticum TaxID=926360 RepID=A0AAV3TD14_9EURY
MVSKQIDGIDVPFIAIYTLMGVLTTGIGTFTLFGFDFSAVLTTLVGFEVTAAFLVSIISIVVIGATNELDPTDLATEQRALLGATLFVMVISSWVPEVQSAITGSDMIGLPVFVLYTAAVGSISYLG